MKLLRKKDYEEIRLWVYRNARPIELARWQFHFEEGSKENVLAALAIYQNADGGFGNSLEPDNWNPYSTSYTTHYAIRLLNEIDGIDMDHPILKGIVRYLDSRVETNENGWLFNVPSNDDYPHAPWWTYNPDANLYESTGVTAGLVDFILRYVDETSELYEYALKLAEKLIHRLDTGKQLGEMEVAGYMILSDVLKMLDISHRFDLNSVDKRIKELINTTIEHDISKWIYHCKTPRDFIDSPDSKFYMDNKEITDCELDYIIDTRMNDGVWNISWSWFDNNEKYAKEFSITENWWKVDLAITTLLHLRNFNRIEK